MYSKVTHSDVIMEYAIQAGAYKSMDNALILKKKIDDYGFEPFYIKKNGYILVRFGEFSTKKEAENEALKARAAGIINEYKIVDSPWVLVHPKIEYGPDHGGYLSDGLSDSGPFKNEKVTVEKLPMKKPENKITKTDKPEPKKDTAAPKVNTVRAKLVKTAHNYIGIPYKWGGTSPKTGFDCSGLTSTTYKKNGISIARTSSRQYRQGKAVTKNQLRKGDLVFFATGRAWRVSHVGMYIGDGKFIHAPSSGKKVRIERLNNSWYRKRFVGAKRFVS